MSYHRKSTDSWSWRRPPLHPVQNTLMNPPPVHRKECKKKLKLGMSAKCSNGVCMPQVWPHNNLDLLFIPKQLDFIEVTLEHLVAGELKVIKLVKSKPQVQGRLLLLKQLQTGKYWVLSGVGNGESKWHSDFQLLKMLVIGVRNKGSEK